MTKQQLTKKEEIVKLLMTETDLGNFAVERALIVLYARQTEDEKASEITSHKNGMGFTGTDAEFYTSLAKKVIASTYPNGKRLSTKMLATLRKPHGITKYAGQLVLVSEAKNALKQAA